MRLKTRRAAGRHGLFAVAVVCLGIAGSAGLPAFADAPSVADGRRLFRDGIGPGGEPLTALVANDVQIQGGQLNCRNCHGRSGLGSTEGSYIVPAIAGPILFSPYPQPERPGYDLESLGRALREGVSASGRALSPLMPRYRLTDREVAALHAYLGSLTTGPAPGVDDENIHFATVITDDVGAAERDAVLDVIRQFADEKNRQTRLDSKRWDRLYKPESVLPTLFRNWVHEVWTLTGPSEGWADQLETYYRSKPAFALLGGLSHQSWAPVARFCERREIPCLFPSTNYPGPDSGQVYTLYYSPGVRLEAGLIASHLAEQPLARVVQLYCGKAGAAAAAELDAALEGRKLVVEQVGFDCASRIPAERVASSLGDDADTAIVAWLTDDHLDDLAALAAKRRIYVSSSRLQGDLERNFPFIGGSVFLTHPLKLPGKPDSAMKRFQLWARTRKIDVTYPRQQAEAYFACLAASKAIKHIERYFVGDYVLDMFDHVQGLAEYLPLYPNTTFGPNQRFVTKGGYLVPVVDGRPDFAAAAWVLP